MDSRVLIAPSILSADLAVLGDQVAACEAAGADWIHVDVMDGHFVPAISFGVPVVDALRGVTRLPLDVHLMVEPVERHLDVFVEAGADSLTVHVEAARDVGAVLRRIRRLGARVGLSLKPGTPESAVTPYLDDLDVLLVMTVEPGASGQPFMPAMLPRIESLAGRIHDRGARVDLEVDGGVNPTTAPLAVRAGARVLVAASAVFGAPQGIGPAIQALRRAAATPFPDQAGLR